MLQKVSLIGLLAFIDRGSILQCLVGLVITNLVLLAMMRALPYEKWQTNVLSVMGQGVIVLSFLSAVLLRVDLDSESFTVDAIGTVIVLANIVSPALTTRLSPTSPCIAAVADADGCCQQPMCVYVVYDTYETMKDELMTAQTDLLTSELGGAGARYLCTAEQPVDITEKLARKRRHRCAHACERSCLAGLASLTPTAALFAGRCSAPSSLGRRWSHSRRDSTRRAMPACRRKPAGSRSPRTDSSAPASSSWSWTTSLRGRASSGFTSRGPAPPWW